MNLRFLVLAPLLLLAVACDEEWTDESDLTLTPGFSDYDEQSGVVSFVAIDQRPTILMELGFQGGQHIQPTVVSPDLEAYADVPYRLEIVDPVETDVVLAELTSYTSAFPAQDIGEDPSSAYTSPRVVLEDRSLVGQVVEVRLRLDGPDGRVGRVRFQGEVALHDPFADQ